MLQVRGRGVLQVRGEVCATSKGRGVLQVRGERCATSEGRGVCYK